MERALNKIHMDLIFENARHVFFEYISMSSFMDSRNPMNAPP